MTYLLCQYHLAHFKHSIHVGIHHYYPFVGYFHICKVMAFVNFAIQMFSLSALCFCVFLDSTDAKYPCVGGQ